MIFKNNIDWLNKKKGESYVFIAADWRENDEFLIHKIRSVDRFDVNEGRMLVDSSDFIGSHSKHSRVFLINHQHILR